MCKDYRQKAHLPGNFDVDEVSNDSDGVNHVIYAGTIEMWKMQEFSERAKVRPYITGIVMSIWGISLIASALRLLITGDFLPIIPLAAISPPLYIILRFYFRSG